jgi:hypothetical protein
MRKIINLTPEVKKALEHQAIDNGLALKPYIEKILTERAKVKTKHRDNNPLAM